MQNPKIHKTPDGKGYYARFRTPDGKQPRITRRRKSDVQRELNAQLAAIEQGNWINPNDGCVTVTDWITDWHSTRHIVDARTQANYIRLYIEPHIGHIQLRHLTPLRIRQWVATLDQYLSPDTTRKAHGILDAALKQAVRDRIITANPCDTTPLPRRTQPEHRYLSPEEVHRLADSIDPRYRVLVYTGVRTGLRGSELVALRKTNLDLPRRRLTVTHSATEYDDRVEFTPGGKTAAARRTITIDQGLADMLAVHLDQTGIGKVTAIRWEDAPLLFTAPNGGPLYRRNFRKRFWNPAVAASVGRPMRMHDMRHTHVGLILASTPQTSPKIIADRLGHEDIRMTLDTYGHLFGGFDEGIADALGDAFATAEATPDQATA